jgi:hypothetical protein
MPYGPTDIGGWVPPRRQKKKRDLPSSVKPGLGDFGLNSSASLAPTKTDRNKQKMGLSDFASKKSNKQGGSNSRHGGSGGFNGGGGGSGSIMDALASQVSSLQSQAATGKGSLQEHERKAIDDLGVLYNHLSHFMKNSRHDQRQEYKNVHEQNKAAFSSLLDSIRNGGAHQRVTDELSRLGLGPEAAGTALPALDEDTANSLNVARTDRANAQSLNRESKAHYNDLMSQMLADAKMEHGTQVAGVHEATTQAIGALQQQLQQQMASLQAAAAKAGPGGMSAKDQLDILSKTLDIKKKRWELKHLGDPSASGDTTNSGFQDALEYLQGTGSPDENQLVSLMQYAITHGSQTDTNPDPTHTGKYLGGNEGLYHYHWNKDDYGDIVKAFNRSLHKRGIYSTQNLNALAHALRIAFGLD